MRETFDKVYEAYFSRFTAGCFYPGDVVAFDIETIKTLDSYKSLPIDLKSRLDGMMEAQQSGDAVVVVAAVDVNPLLTRDYAPAVLTLAFSHGGGRWVDPISLPGSIGEGIKIVEQGTNLNNLIPSKARINHDEFNTGPKEVDLKELEKNRFNPTTGGLF